MNFSSKSHQIEYEFLLALKIYLKRAIKNHSLVNESDPIYKEIITDIINTLPNLCWTLKRRMILCNGRLYSNYFAEAGNKSSDFFREAFQSTQQEIKLKYLKSEDDEVIELIQENIMLDYVFPLWMRVDALISNKNNRQDPIALFTHLLGCEIKFRQTWIHRNLKSVAGISFAITAILVSLPFIYTLPIILAIVGILYVSAMTFCIFKIDQDEKTLTKNKLALREMTEILYPSSLQGLYKHRYESPYQSRAWTFGEDNLISADEKWERQIDKDETVSLSESRDTLLLENSFSGAHPDPASKKSNLGWKRPCVFFSSPFDSKDIDKPLVVFNLADL